MKLGKLKSIGVECPYQVPLNLPQEMIDLTKVESRLPRTMFLDKSVNFLGEIRQPPSINYIPGKTSKAQYTLFLESGETVEFTEFGSEKQLRSIAEERIGQKLLVHGFLIQMGKKLFLNGVKIYPQEFAGCLLPNYKSKPKVITPDKVRELTLKLLDRTIPLTVDFILNEIGEKQVSQVVDPSKLDMVLRSAHRPQAWSHFYRANEVLEALAAILSKKKVENHLKMVNNHQVPQFNALNWRDFLENLTFTLTDEQVGVLDSIANELNKSSPCRGLIQADVGLGKTIIFALLAITGAFNGHRVAILLPNTSLAKQVYEEITQLIPDDKPIITHFISGESGEIEFQYDSSEVLVGTTALLFREVGEFQLVVCDEQQKYSREQREKLTKKGCHLIESTATPIPRSVALLKYGVMKEWRLTKNHSNKVINSHLLIGRENGKQLIRMVFDAIRSGKQAIVVYAMKEESECEAMNDVASAEKAYRWWERHLPGQVRLVHSKMSDERKVKSLSDLKKRKASLLIATTAIEVGVTLPDVTLLGLIDADRFGLTSAHQLRGRICRRGGEGHFVMLVQKEKPNPKTIERLKVMLETNNGFEVAEKDLELRGYGDLAVDGNNQKGSDDSFLIGRKVNPKILDQIMAAES